MAAIINFKDYFGNEWQKGLSDIEKRLSSLVQSFEEIAETSKKFQSEQTKQASKQAEIAKNIQQVNQETEKLTGYEKELIKIQQQYNQILDKTGAELSEENVQLLQAKANRAQLNKTIKEEINLNNSAAGSYENLNSQLKIAIADYKALSKSERESSKGKELQNKIQGLDKELKGLDKSIGIHNRNVGNYASALENLPGPFGQAVNGAKALGKQLWALVTNPIVAIIAAIVLAVMALFKAFKSTDSGATSMAAKMEQLRAVMDVIRVTLVKVVEWIINAVKRFKELRKETEEKSKGLKILGKAIETYLLWPLKLTITQVTAVVKLFKKAFPEMAKQMEVAAEAAKKYTYAMDKLDDSENNYISTLAENKNKIAQLEFTAQDRTKSVQERRKAIQEAIDLSEQEAKQSKIFSEQRLKNEVDYLAGKNKVRSEDIIAFIKMTDEEQANASKSLVNLRNNYEDKFKEIEELYAKTIEADTKFFEENKSNISKLSGFDEEIRKEQEQKAEEARRNQEEIRKEREQKAEEARRNQLEKEKKQVEKIALARKMAEDSSILEQKKQLEQKIINEQQFQENVLLIQLGFIQKDLENTKLTSEQKLEFEKQLIDKKIELNAFYDEQEKANNEQKLKNFEYNTNQELNELLKKLQQKQLTEQQFAEQILQLELINLQKRLGLTFLDKETRLSIEQEIIQKQIELQGMLTEKTAEEVEKRKELFQEQLDQTQQLYDGVFAIGSALTERETQRISEQKDFELKLAGDNEKEKARIQEKYDNQRKIVQRNQAISDKLQAIFTASINVAVAITKSLSNPYLAAFTALLGGLQIAAIIAKPIPKFAHGIKNFTGGLAEVGEQGREIVRTPEGMFLSPNKSTFVALPKGSDVIPNLQTELLLKGNDNYKFDELIKSNNRLEKAILSKPENISTLTDAGLKRAYKDNKRYVEYLDTYIRK
jgi:hypothetical protein